MHGVGKGAFWGLVGSGSDEVYNYGTDVYLRKY